MADKRRRAIAGCALVLLGTACSSADTSRTPQTDGSGDVPEAERYGGTAVVALNRDPQSLHPLVLPTNETTMLQTSLLSLRLVRYGEDLQYEPQLAKRWDTVRVTPDTLELTFHLRRDVLWHDGTPTTADDVVFTFERAVDPRTASPHVDMFRLYSRSVERLDSFTVRFRVRASPDLLVPWMTRPPVPRHLLGNAAPEEMYRHPFGQQPVGNGPFRFVRRVRGQEIVLEANPDFPEALGGRPYLDRIVFRVIPDPTARLTELLVGGVDLLFLAPEQVERVSAARGVRLIEYPHSAWTQIAWNTRRAPFDDAQVRRALSLAIDRSAIVDGVLHGHAEPGRWTATPVHWQYDADDPETEPRHAPDEAQRLLAEAGWQDRDGDGIVEDAEGRPFRFTLLSFRESATHPQSATVIQAQLRRIGVDMQTRLLEEASAFALVEGQQGADGERVRDYDAVLTNWETGRSSDDSWFLHSRNRNDPLGLTSYADPRADAWMDTLTSTLDREAARPLWREYQRLMVREAPVTVLYYPKALAAVSHRLQGVEMFASAPYVTAPRWWILPSERR